MRIFVVSGYSYWGDWTPADIFERPLKDLQVGGGETAMIQISTALAGLGHEVFLFYDTSEPMEYRGVQYVPTRLFQEMATSIEHDVLISWDAPWAFRFADRAKVRVLSFQLNDPSVGAYDWTIDLYMHPSEWHATRTREMCPEVSQRKQVVRVTNGVDYDRYMHKGIQKVPGRVIYSSSPDRGLHHLLRVWPRIAARIPAAELHVFYDINRWLRADADLVARGLHTVTSDRAAILRDFLINPPPRTFFHGGIGQHRLAEEQLRSCVMAYPCDPVRPTEGFSMTILEGITAGLHVVTTDADALGELWGGAPNVTILPLPIDDDMWVNAICDRLSEPALEPLMNLATSWGALAQMWERRIRECLQDQTQ